MKFLRNFISGKATGKSVFCYIGVYSGNSDFLYALLSEKYNNLQFKDEFLNQTLQLLENVLIEVPELTNPTKSFEKNSTNELFTKIVLNSTCQSLNDVSDEENSVENLAQKLNSFEVEESRKKEKSAEPEKDESSENPIYFDFSETPKEDLESHITLPLENFPFNRPAETENMACKYVTRTLRYCGLSQEIVEPEPVENNKFRSVKACRGVLMIPDSEKLVQSKEFPGSSLDLIYISRETRDILRELIGILALKTNKFILKRDTAHFGIEYWTTFTVAINTREFLVGFVKPWKAEKLNQVFNEYIEMTDLSALAHLGDLGESRENDKDASDTTTASFYLINILHNLEIIKIGSHLIRINPLYQVEAHAQYPKFCGGNTSQVTPGSFRTWIQDANRKHFQHCVFDERMLSPEFNEWHWEEDFGWELEKYLSIVNHLCICGKEELYKTAPNLTFDKEFYLNLLEALSLYDFQILTVPPNTHPRRVHAKKIFINTPRILLSILRDELNFCLNAITTNEMEKINMFVNAKISSTKRIKDNSFSEHIHSKFIKQKICCILGIEEDAENLQFICEH